MLSYSRLSEIVPNKVLERLDPYLEALDVFMQIKDRNVLRSLAPPGIRGMLLKRGKQGVPTLVSSSHRTYFDWTYPHDQPEMEELYRRAKQGQWDGENLPWDIDVDPMNPEVPLIPDKFIDFDAATRAGVKLSEKELRAFRYSMASWMLSQFLHGEQGALYAAAQVTEAVHFFDGKMYGATQVVDEARHVEVFHRYLSTKLNKLYQVNDNLFVIIDALISDGRWDMKFLGMQIMVEGLALGAFGMLYQNTREPLLKELLKMVIQDEARHVHYGVLALRQYFIKELSESARREREDWAFEVALLMRNRFMAYEVYEEWFEGLLSRTQWRQLILRSPGMEAFRCTMFSRLVPNLREIGILTPRIQPHYEREGLMRYFHGDAADRITGQQLIHDLDTAA